MANSDPAKYNPHPKKVKQAQNALILARGNIKEACHASGIAQATMQRYLKAGLIDRTLQLDGEDNAQALEELAANRNERLSEDMLDAAELAVGQVKRRLVDASAKDAAIVTGVMIEKANLLQGKATKHVAIDISDNLEILKRHGIVVEEEVIEAEIVGIVQGSSA